jgi:hypothetical protein
MPSLFVAQQHFGPWIFLAYVLSSCFVLFVVSESESSVTTDGQSASLSWSKAPIWALQPDFYYRQAVAGLLMWGALSVEITGLSFTIAAGSRQCSHSCVLVL